MRRSKLAAIATLLVPLFVIVLMRTSSSHSQDQKPTNQQPQVSWNDFLSAENLQGEMRKTRDRLKATLANVGTYNGNYKTITVDGTVIAALAGIAIEHPGRFEWKANAPSIRDAGRELAEASTGLGREKFEKSKFAFDKLESVFSGTIPADAPKPKPSRPFHETVDRANAMKRIEIAKDKLRDTITSTAILGNQQAAVSRDTQLIAALGRIIATDGYPSADEQDYQDYAADLVSSIQDASTAAKDLSLPDFKMAMTSMSKSCDHCHANYGNDELPDLIANRLKRIIDVDFKRTPMQEAFAFISNEIKTPITIDGDALKAGGFTKNMPQTFQGDKISARDAIAKILEKYQDPQKPSQTMVIVVDEDKQTILVTTKGFCEKQKLTPYEVFKK